MSDWLGTNHILGRVLSLGKTPRGFGGLFIATGLAAYPLVKPKSISDFICFPIFVAIADWILFVVLMLASISGDQFAQIILPKIVGVPNQRNPLHQVIFLLLSVLGLPLGFAIVLWNSWRRF